ncbi:MAG: hypothetical protein KDJ38_20475 [Gammaproteobacteria bacterium]|nr:hypothetical protein [Gammaproteobacteria bacterium]
MMVTMAVMSIVMIGIFQVFQEGMQLFRTNSKASDAQQSAIRVLGVISAELVNATPEVSKNYDSGSGEPTGVVFATSLTEDGATRFNEFNGKIYWQRYIAYYFEPDPVEFNGKIIRAVLPVPDDPSGGPGHLDVANVVAPFINSTPTSAFQSNGSKKKMIADAISGFNVTVYDGSEGGNTGLAKNKVFEVTVEAGNPESQQLRNGYFIQVQSRIAPRG